MSVQRQPSERPIDHPQETRLEFPQSDESHCELSGDEWFECHREMSSWLIQQNRCVLVKNGDFSHIRDNLLQAAILTSDEVEDIEALGSRNKQMRKFVDILCRKPGDVIEKCCKAIREADDTLYSQLQWPIPTSQDQEHEAEVDGQISGTRGKGSPRPGIIRRSPVVVEDANYPVFAFVADKNNTSSKMSSWLIQQNRCVLVENGEYPRIRNKLLQEGILTTDEDEDITAERARYKQMTVFVDILCRKADNVIEQCCEAIRQADAILYNQLQWPVPPIPDPVHQTERDGQISGDLSKIQQELKSWYTKQLSRYHPIPWCDWVEMDFDHVYTNLKIVHGRKNQLSCRGQLKSLKNAKFIEDLGVLLFSRDDRTVTFIQGSAGIGKSTLCRRLAHLWATQNYCIHGRHFDLVLLVEARSVVGDSLKRSMYQQLFSEDFDLTEDTVYKCISKCQEKCLLIIDGVDELTQEGRRAVLELLQGRFLRDMNIILTGRPESVQDFIKYANNHLKVTGFTKRNVKSYISKYFDDDKKELQDILLSRLYRYRETQDVDGYKAGSDDSDHGSHDNDSRDDSDDDSDDDSEYARHDDSDDDSEYARHDDSDDDSEYARHDDSDDDSEYARHDDSDDDSEYSRHDDVLRKLSVNPFTTLLLCLLVEEKGDDIPSNVNDILQEVITLTVKRYTRKIGTSKHVTQSDLLNCAAGIAYMGFREEKVTFEEKRIKELYPSGLGDQVLKSGLLSSDFTMSKLHTVGYCYFPHKSIQDYLSAKYLANMEQERLDETLMRLTLEDYQWWLDVVKKLLYQLKGQKSRLQKSVLYIVDKCPVYKKVKPGFEKYVGRLTCERRDPQYTREMVVFLILIKELIKVCEECADACFRVVSANGEVLRFLMHYVDPVSEELNNLFQSVLALPCILDAERKISKSSVWYTRWDTRVREISFAKSLCGNVPASHGHVLSREMHTVNHKTLYMYPFRYISAPRQWHHTDFFQNISWKALYESTEWPSVLSVLILPGIPDTWRVKDVIDTLNSVKTKLTLFLILPNLQCEDLYRMKLLALFMSELNDNVRVCYECPNIQVCCERLISESVTIAYTNPVPVHHMYYNKYCPF